jgi:transposase
MFQDEGRFGRISDPRRCWGPHPIRPDVKAAMVREYIYAYAALSPWDDCLDSLILPDADTEGMNIFLAEVARRHSDDFIVLVLDGAGWHRARALKVPANMTLLPLPPYSPQLNPVEHLWDELREKSFHNQVFASLDAVEERLCQALAAFEPDRARIHKLAAWPWIESLNLNAD